MRRAATSLPFLLLTLASGVVAGQNPPPATPTFRSGVELLQLDVSVLDKARRPVEGLGAEDFTVLVDGKPRPVVAFKAVTLPPPAAAPTAPWMRDTAPDVVSNTHQPGRLVVILIDDGSFRQRDPPAISDASGQGAVADIRAVMKARETARKVVDALGPDDLAAVIFTENNHSIQDFTNDRRRLLDAIDHASLTPSSRHDPIVENGGPVGSIACLGLMCGPETLRTLAEVLRGAPEQRKIVFYISVGVPLFDDILDHYNAQRLRVTNEALRQAALANVIIASFDPKGLTVNTATNGPLRDAAKRRTEFLRSVAENTGGRAVVNNNDMDLEVPAVLAESSSYYLLGVESPVSGPVSGKDGQFRAISVRVNRPDVEVRTRRGYYDLTAKERRAASAPASSMLVSSISGVLAKSDIPLGVAAAPFAGRDGRPVIAITLNVTQRPSLDAGTERLDVIVTATIPEVSKVIGTNRIAMNVPVNTTAADKTFEVLSRLPVRSGRYQVSIGVETGDGRTASVHAPVEIPDFGSDLSLSGLILSAEPSPTVAPKDTFADLLPVVPTARRAFKVEDRVTAFLRIYQNRSTFIPAAVRMRITDAANIVTTDITSTLTSRLSGKHTTADFLTDLPIARLPTGEYLLTVDVTADGKKAQRVLRFTVQ